MTGRIAGPILFHEADFRGPQCLKVVSRKNQLVQLFRLKFGKEMRDWLMCAVLKPSTLRSLKCKRLTINRPEAVSKLIPTDSWHRMAAIIRSKLSLNEIVCYLFESGKLRHVDDKWHINITVTGQDDNHCIDPPDTCSSDTSQLNCQSNFHI